MGHQISLLAAMHGFETWCADIVTEQLVKAQAFVDRYLPERVAKERITQEEADSARRLLHFTPDLVEAAASADFVIEAATEKLDLKRKIFKQLDEVCPPHAILATNSSFIVSSLVADATARPDKVCNMHFFNPALVMKIVEVVKGPHTSEETAATTVELTRGLGKTPVMVNKEIYGFIVNRLLFEIYKEAFYLVNEEVASVEDIDTAMEGALGHPMGPFRTIDLSGVDLVHDILRDRYAETGIPRDAPPQFLADMVKAGKLGQKSGSGFYDYSEVKAKNK
jgi:3-hydroxybutyryl-CoA dehydrogenase